jgi:NADPH2:quinone reductase
LEKDKLPPWFYLTLDTNSTQYCLVRPESYAIIPGLYILALCFAQQFLFKILHNEERLFMDKIRAVLVDPDIDGRLTIGEVPAPIPASSEVLVRVASISLNRGEVRGAMSAEKGWRPGWDLAGTVEQTAADGSGPPVGARVVGFVTSGAWAEVVAVPTNALAQLPDNVSFAQAATLPVAGLTALYTLEWKDSLLGRVVLITGASGGVGLFAVQLARLMGARVVGAVRQSGHEKVVREAGAHEVVIGEDLALAKDFGPYDIILESVGGQSLSTALTLLARAGICVSFGVSSGSAEVTFDARNLFLTGNQLYGFLIFNETGAKPASKGLARLAQLISEGRLRTYIDLEADWTQIGEVAQKLLNRQFTGKAVLHISK